MSSICLVQLLLELLDLFIFLLILHLSLFEIWIYQRFSRISLAKRCSLSFSGTILHFFILKLKCILLFIHILDALFQPFALFVSCVPLVCNLSQLRLITLPDLNTFGFFPVQESLHSSDALLYFPDISRFKISNNWHLVHRHTVLYSIDLFFKLSFVDILLPDFFH